MVKKKNKKINSSLFLSILLLILIIFFVFAISQLNFKIYNENNFYEENFILFLLYKNKLINEIFEKEPDVIKVNFKINLFKKEIRIEKTKEEPVALICYKESCYFLGEHSYIYNIKNLKKEGLIKIESTYPVYPDSYLNKEITNALSKIFEYSNLKPLPIKEIRILTNFDLEIKTPKFSLLIDPYKDVSSQLKKLDFFLENYSTSTFSRIDLRIPQKIYFK